MSIRLTVSSARAESSPAVSATSFSHGTVCRVAAEPLRQVADVAGELEVGGTDFPVR